MRPIQRQKDTFAYRVAAFDQSMLDRLHGEFTDWYNQNGAAHFEDHVATSGWPEKTLRSMAERAVKERGPVGYWPNVEGFLKAKYPASHKNLFMGYEDARTRLDWEWRHPDEPVADKSVLYETGPQAEAAHGYDPKEIAAAMLLLHNKSDPDRNQWGDATSPHGAVLDIAGEDIARLNEIAQKRSEMQRAFEQRAAASNRTVSLSPSPDTDSIVYGLSSEFNDWAKANNKGNPYDERYLAMPIEQYAKAVPRNWKPRGPVGYWPNIEEFMKEKYPAAHRGLSMGFEDADPLLDSGGKHKDGTDLEWLVGKDPYETGPDAVAKHGYDPREVAATLLLLHNDTHPGRENYLKSDQARLLDIAQKRHQMQRAYDERMQQKVTATLRYAQQVLAMPWQDWSDKINDSTEWLDGPGCTSGACGKTNIYHVMHRPGTSFLNYDHKSVEVTTDDGPVSVPYLAVNTIHVDPNYRKDGIAEALMRRLHDDHPGVFINPGPMTDDGRALLHGLTEKIPESRELIIGRAQRSWHQHLASINRLGAELSDADAAMLYDHMQKLFQPITPSGKWYHVSPHALPDGTDLRPGGGDSTSQSFYDDGWGEDTGTLTDMGQGRTGHVWLTPDLNDAHFWSAALNAPHIYEVDPHEDPRPWNGTGTDGWVVPGAKIRRKVIA